MTRLSIPPDEVRIHDVIETEFGPMRVTGWTMRPRSRLVYVAGIMVSTGTPRRQIYALHETLDVHRGHEATPPVAPTGS